MLLTGVCLILIENICENNNFILVGEVFQFFVRATDKGKPSRHADIPVNILIMGPNDFAPVYEKRDVRFFLSENSPAGK